MSVALSESLFLFREGELSWDWGELKVLNWGELSRTMESSGTVLRVRNSSRPPLFLRERLIRPKVDFESNWTPVGPLHLLARYTQSVLSLFLSDEKFLCLVLSLLSLFLNRCGDCFESVRCPHIINVRTTVFWGLSHHAWWRARWVLSRVSEKKEDSSCSRTVKNTCGRSVFKPVIDPVSNKSFNVESSSVNAKSSTPKVAFRSHLVLTSFSFSSVLQFSSCSAMSLRWVPSRRWVVRFPSASVCPREISRA